MRTLKIAVVLFLSFLMGCVTLKPKYDSVNPKFVPYMQYFEQEIYKIPDPIKKDIVMGEEAMENVNILGTCRIFPNNVREISISDFFDLLPSEARYALVIHELIHCVCGWNHDTIDLEDGCPRSFMSPKISPSVCLRRHWDELMVDARNKCNG
jgi:hypothetical protein